MGVTLPKQGTEWGKLKGEMQNRGANDVKWREGKTAVYVFNAGPDVVEVARWRPTRCSCRRTASVPWPFRA